MMRVLGAVPLAYPNQRRRVGAVKVLARIFLQSLFLPCHDSTKQLPTTVSCSRSVPELRVTHLPGPFPHVCVVLACKDRWIPCHSHALLVAVKLRLRPVC